VKFEADVGDEAALSIEVGGLQAGDL